MKFNATITFKKVLPRAVQKESRIMWPILSMEYGGDRDDREPENRTRFKLRLPKQKPSQLNGF